MADTDPKSHWVDLTRAALWPLVIAICLYYWVVPVSHVLNLLPNILGRTQKINIGGVELDITQSALPQPDPGVADKLQQMTSKELETLLSAGDSTHYCPNSDPSWHDPIADIEPLGLSFFGHDGGGGCKDYYVLTDEGRKVREYLITLLTAQFLHKSG
jgi:hypothetical protein